jgi:hypothetical protein
MCEDHATKYHSTFVPNYQLPVTIDINVTEVQTSDVRTTVPLHVSPSVLFNSRTWRLREISMSFYHAHGCHS